MGSGCSSFRAVNSGDTNIVSSLATFKIVLLGESLSGTSSVLNRYVNNSFNENYKPTKNIDIVSIVKKVNFPDERIIAIDFWDVPSHVDPEMVKEYLKNADAAIVTVDICEDKALFYANKWKKIIFESELFTVKQKSLSTRKDQDFPILLIGTKLDLLKSDSDHCKRRKSFIKDNPISNKKNYDINCGDSTVINDTKTTTHDKIKICESIPAQDIEAVNNESQLSNFKTIEVVAIKANPTDHLNTHDSKLSILNNKLNDHDAEASHHHDELSKHHSELSNHADKLNNHDSEVFNHNEESNTHGAEVSNSNSLLNSNEAAAILYEERRINDESDSTKSEEQSQCFSKLNFNEMEIDVVQTAQKEQREAKMVAFNEEVTTDPDFHFTKLKDFAAQNQFFSGICVSSRDSDGGVHEVIQSLVRHLISKICLGYEAKRKIDDTSLPLMSLPKKSKPNQNFVKRFEPLQNIGILELDEVIQLCNKSLTEVEIVINEFYEGLLHFKKACYEEGLVNKSNFEGCIAALKQAIESTKKKDNELSDIRMVLLPQKNQNYSLVAIEKEGFSIQVLDEDHNFIDIHKNCFPENLVALLDVLNETVLTSCTEILNKFGGFQQQLANHHRALIDKEEKAWDVAVAAGRSQSDVRRILTGIAQSKVRVKGTLDQLQDVRRSADQVIIKTKATLLF